MVGVSQRFKLVPPGARSGPQAKTPAAPSGPTITAPPPTSKSVEVDVVAAGGSLWVEVKAHAWFTGASSRATGVAPQAQQALLQSCSIQPIPAHTAPPSTAITDTPHRNNTIVLTWEGEVDMRAL